MQKKLQDIWQKESNVPLVLGSATPDLDHINATQTEEISLLELTKRQIKQVFSVA